MVFDRYTVLQPDLVFVRRARLEIVTEHNVVGAPDLVAQVPSESTRDVDLGRKLCAYARHGVGAYRVVDPDANTIRVFGQEGGTVAAADTAGPGEQVAFLGAGPDVDDVLA